MTRPILTTRASFAPAVVDQVERLLEVLGALREDPLLGSAFVLHGGTALNVFHGDLARLSVDIDVMYVGSADLAGMRRERPLIDARLREVTGKLGYATKAAKDEHSGQTYRLKYGGGAIKIDIGYLARVPLLEPLVMSCGACDPPVEFPVLEFRELVAGKVKALLERTAARDLYDLARVARHWPAFLHDELGRALIVRAVTAADVFPAVSDATDALARFVDPASDVAEPLRAVLPADDQPDFAAMCSAAREMLAPLSRLSGAEAEYVRLLTDDSVYEPELLFGRWPDTLERARRDPVMRWKVENLRRRPSAS